VTRRARSIPRARQALEKLRTAHAAAGPAAIDPDAVRTEGRPNRADEQLALQTDAQALMRLGILTMGDYSYYAPLVRMYAGDTAKVRIGKFSSVAADSEFFVGGMHRTDWVTTYGLRAVFDLPGAYQDGTPTTRGDIEVGNDCWITLGSVVLSGMTIGSGAVVATRAVVTKDVRPYAIVAGNPAREVGRRFPDDQVDALLRIAWWDWPLDTILARVDELSSPDTAAFIERYDPGAS
jgi:acetyltransferase-like isoleucine patch superfamily enzyme